MSQPRIHYHRPDGDYDIWNPDSALVMRVKCKFDEEDDFGKTIVDMPESMSE